MRKYKNDEKVIYNGAAAKVFNYNTRGNFYTLLLANGRMVFHVGENDILGGAR